jgi:hypothetical protein
MTGSKPKSLSPETQLVARFARARLSSLDRQRVSGLLQDGVDWEDVVALARRHRLLPLVASHLRGYRELVPPSVQEDLSRAEHANVVWTLSRAAQLIEAIDALESVDILAVPYKGPALGAQLYGSGALRIFNDLDVVVRPRDVPEARRVLLDLGYVPRTSMTDPEMEFMLRRMLGASLEFHGSGDRLRLGPGRSVDSPAIH